MWLYFEVVGNFFFWVLWELGEVCNYGEVELRLKERSWYDGFVGVGFVVFSVYVYVGIWFCSYVIGVLWEFG